ncbi:MAG: carboxypeptidase-like regulatory domain-containing protein [Bacteroidales bacterium]|nr:carboxypeptidase-like regulatory domain-containing protein [Bacteroidales bacterium]
MKKLIHIIPILISVIISIMLVMGIASPACSQEITKVMGTVKDNRTGEPIPFVNVYFKGTTIGATTDFEGKYSLEIRKPADSVIASYVGYFTSRKPIQPNHFQVVDFSLDQENYELSEVVIRPGENPAEVLLKKIIDNKDLNDPDKKDTYHCEVYTKMQFDANNLSDKLLKRKVLEPFKFVFEHMDTSTVNGKAYLPVMLSESFSNMYYRRSPRARKEIINASQISGIENATIAQFGGNLAQNVNIYDNFIDLFQKNFPSPINGMGLLYYRYYLVDSAFLGNNWCYNIMFKPRRKQEYAFTGNFWVHDSTFAIKKVEMRMVDDANMNFINDMVISQEFEQVDGRQWMLTRDHIVADFNLIEDAKVTMGFYGTRTAIFRKYSFSPVKDEKIFNTPNNIIVQDNAIKRDQEFWAKSRPEDLTYRESSVYRLADTLKKMPIFNTYLDIAQTVFTGYYVNGNFEWGPYASTYSFNSIEGNRFRIGGRTSNDFSTRIMFDGYAAYGLKDNTLKYKLGMIYMVNKIPDRILTASYKHDMEQLGVGDDAFREDFFFNSLFRRNPQDKLSMVDELKWAYKHEWYTGFSNTIGMNNRKIYTLGGEGIKLYDYQLDQYISRNQITTTEVTLDLHYGYHEKVLAGEFERVTVSSPYPVLDLQYSYGFKNLLASDFEYHKAKIRVTQWFNSATTGWSKYYVEAGKTWGRLPFPLMKIHNGNETFWYDETAFNLMNYYEFVSDEYVNFLFTHHFEGFFLNRIPAIRKLKWREVAQIRGAMGHTTDANKQYNFFPEGTYTLGKPYFEAGVGIENIFRFIRIDGIWRLSYNDHPNANRFGVMMSMNFNF